VYLEIEGLEFEAGYGWVMASRRTLFNLGFCFDFVRWYEAKY